VQKLETVFADECLGEKKEQKLKACCAQLHTTKKMFGCGAAWTAMLSLWSLVFVWGTKPGRNLASALKQRQACAEAHGTFLQL